MAILLMASVVLPPFVKVTDCAALLDPGLTEPKERLAGLTVKVLAAEVPLPVKVTVWVPALSVKFSVAARLPVVTGAKIIFAVQLAEAASVEPHVLE